MPKSGLQVLVATNNKGKIPEIIDSLNMDGWQYLTLAECGIIDDPKESGATYEDNARIKVMSARMHKPKMAIIADDSGLEVDALGGEPGIYSARYCGEGSNDQNNIEKLLEKLSGIADEQRTARFVSTIVFSDEHGQEFVAKGACEGKIALEPKGTNGFGYDPVFLPDDIDDGRTMAELSAVEKDAISHRGRALKNLREQLTPVVSIVAFDLDDTVLEGHSPVRMIKKLVLQGVLSPTVAIKSTFWGIQYKLQMPVKQATARKYVFKGFSHVPAKDAILTMQEFYNDDLRRRLRPKALEAIKKHQDAGDIVVVVSASFDPIVKEAAKDIGAAHYVSTQMEVKDGYYTGSVLGEVPEGVQKLIQLTSWANAKYGKGCWRLSTAYGDHRSDRFLLAAAKRAVAVNPDSGLSKAQKAAGWEAVDWSFDPDAPL